MKENIQEKRFEFIKQILSVIVHHIVHKNLKIIFRNIIIDMKKRVIDENICTNTERFQKKIKIKIKNLHIVDCNVIIA